MLAFLFFFSSCCGREDEEEDRASFVTLYLSVRALHHLPFEIISISPEGWERAKRTLWAFCFMVHGIFWMCFANEIADRRRPLTDPLLAGTVCVCEGVFLKWVWLEWSWTVGPIFFWWGVMVVMPACLVRTGPSKFLSPTSPHARGPLLNSDIAFEVLPPFPHPSAADIFVAVHVVAIIGTFFLLFL